MTAGKAQVQPSGNHDGRILIGPEAAIATSERRHEEDSRRLWPYPWVMPPKNAISRSPAASIVAPAVATQTVILAFTVPQGHTLVWSEYILSYDGGGFVPGSSDIVWTIDVDTAIGISGLAGAPIPDLQSILTPRGSYANGPWKHPRALEVKAGQTLRAKVTTTAAITPGAPNYFSALFGGWLVPAVRR